MRNTRLAGHGLLNEGRPFSTDGKTYLGPGARSGHGKCSCGAVSSFLTSNAERQRWHRDHKTTISGVES